MHLFVYVSGPIACHRVHAEIIEQFSGIHSLLAPCVFQDQAQVVRWDSTSLAPMSNVRTILPASFLWLPDVQSMRVSFLF